MATTIDPGPGFRLLATGEVTRAGDQYSSGGGWLPGLAGLMVNAVDAPQRRRRAIRLVGVARRWLDDGETILPTDIWQEPGREGHGRTAGELGACWSRILGDHGQPSGWTRVVPVPAPAEVTPAPAPLIHRSAVHGALCGAVDVFFDALTYLNDRVTCAACLARIAERTAAHAAWARDRIDEILRIDRQGFVLPAEPAPVHYVTIDASGLVKACEAGPLAPAGIDGLSRAPKHSLTCAPCMERIATETAAVLARRAAWDAEMAGAAPAALLAPIDHEDFV